MKTTLKNLGLVLGLTAITQLAFTGTSFSKTTSMATLEKQRVNFRHTKTKTVRNNATNKLALNRVAPNFAFTNLDGKTRRFSSFRGKPVLFFLADTTCPCVKAYAGRMKTLQQKYGKRGLRIVYLYSQAKETRAEIAAYNKQYGFTWESAIDTQQKLLRLFDGRCSSEAYLFDGKGVLRYHGALDDSNFNESNVAKRHAENALLAILSGKRVAKPEVETLGCDIPRVKA